VNIRSLFAFGVSRQPVSAKPVPAASPIAARSNIALANRVERKKPNCENPGHANDTSDTGWPHGNRQLTAISFRKLKRIY
jgi:hypothetical protein